MDTAVVPHITGHMDELIRVAVLTVILLIELVLYARRREPVRTKWPREMDLVLIYGGLAVSASFLWF